MKQKSELDETENWFPRPFQSDQPFLLKKTMLEQWYEFGRIDWVVELEYPEWTNKEVNQFLRFEN